MASRATFFAILRVRPDNVANLHCKLSLLRARRERPGGRRAAEQRGELAPFHQQFLPCFEAEDSTAGDLLHCGISGPSMTAMGQTRSFGNVGSMSGLPESGQGRAIYGRYGDARLTAACARDISCGRMTWPLQNSLDDIFAGPGPADPPSDEGDEGLALLEELVRAVGVLAERLKHEPGLRREAARLFCKLESNVPGTLFRPVIWPLARLQAGLSAHAKAGRPVGARTRKKTRA